MNIYDREVRSIICIRWLYSDDKSLVLLFQA